MKVRKGDKVIVIAGKDRGKTGTVSEAFPQNNQVLIEGINIKKKHVRSRQKDKPGQVVEKPAPLHASNVMLVDPKTSKRTRVSIVRKDGKRVRVAKKSGEEL